MYRGLPWEIYWHIFRLTHVAGGLTDIQYHILLAACQRGDEAEAFIHLRDWGKKIRNAVEIGKFVPGKHWHVLGVKFDTYEEAEWHAKMKGYEISRVNYQRITPVGD